MGTACKWKQSSPSKLKCDLAIQPILNTLVLYCLKLTREDVFCWRCTWLVVRRWWENWHSWWTCYSFCVMLQQNSWSATLSMCLFSGATQVKYLPGFQWSNTHACMSEYTWQFFTLKQKCGLSEGLSEPVGFILPCGNTGSEGLRESRLNLDTSYKTVTSEVNYL